MIYLLKIFNDSPSFEFEFRLMKPIKGKADFVEASFKIKPKQMFKKIGELMEKNLPSINNRLFEHFPDKVYEEPGLDMSKLSAAGYKIYDCRQKQGSI